MLKRGNGCSSTRADPATSIETWARSGDRELPLRGHQHDRFPRPAHILAFEGDSRVEWFEGNFEAYEEDKIRRLGEEATRPHRMTYRKLTR
jgi:hypothetical protein